MLGRSSDCGTRSLDTRKNQNVNAEDTSAQGTAVTVLVNELNVRLGPGTNYSAAIKTNSPRIALLRNNDSAAKEALESARWTVYSLEDLLSDEDFESFCTLFIAP